MKRIEISGFKSFADKTDFELGEGLTAVVGPNGSGKSNLAEAVKWVLGEQSARLLRGTRMDDVIFCGTEKRKGVGLAEVTLVFDNADRRLPIDPSEVSITRRVYRSGDAEYFINRKACRLKDIAELFLDTGIGKDSYSFVGQGRMEEILSSDPRNRRVIFEEATGISRYKLRKKETEARLSDTEANLRRLQDIAWELETQLSPLMAEAERAKQYLHLVETRSKWEKDLLLYEVALAERQHLSLRTQGERLQDEILHAESRIAVQEADEASSALYASAASAILGDVEKALLEHTLRCEQRSERLCDTRREYERALARERQLIEMQARLGEDESRLALELSAAEAELTTMQRALQQKSHELMQYAAPDANDCSAGEDDRTDSLAVIEEQLLRIRGDLAAIEQKEQTLDEVNARKSDQHKDILVRLADKHEQREREQQEYKELSLRLGQTKSEHSMITAALKQLHGEIRTLEQALQRAEGEAHSAETRHRALQASEAQLEGFSRGARYVLSTNIPGVLGAVGRLISTKEQYEVAIEVALGAAIGDVVTDREATAKQAIALLKAKGQGRATFYPLDTMKPRASREFPAHLTGVQGFLGRAVDLVDYPPELESVIRQTLGSVLLATGLDEASAVAARTGYTWRVVTLDGDVILPGGSLTGGSRPERQAWLLSRRRELEEAARTWGDKRSALESICGQLAVKRTTAEELAASSRLLSAQTAEQEQTVQKAQQRLARLSEEHRYLTGECAAVDTELSRVLSLRGDLRNEFANLRAVSENLTMRHAEVKSKVEELAQVQAENNVRRLELTVETLRLESQVAQLEGQIAERKKSVVAARLRRDEWAREVSMATDATSDFRQRAISLQGEISLLQVEIETLTRQAEQGRKAQEVHRVAQAKLQATLLELRRELNNAKQKFHNVELRTERVRAEEDFVKQQLRQRFVGAEGLSSTLGSRGEAEAAMHELDAHLNELGPVRVSAVSECERLGERIAFLAREQEDLRQAAQQLQGVMAELDQVMGDRFVSGFKLIQKAFCDVTTRLFGGATASLYLSDPERPLESGIEVDVQPFGKRLQSITLLSGGERALVALSLLCAVLKVKPTPFCVLDEIDAPLDEANVERLITVLRELCVHTQFLIITHTRGTMMAADMLYGVTMREEGVSKVLAVKVSEIAGA